MLLCNVESKQMRKIRKRTKLTDSLQAFKNDIETEGAEMAGGGIRVIQIRSQ
jgi:hypothetical protein